MTGELLHQNIAQLTIEGETVNGPDGLQSPAMSAGTCFDFNKTKEHLYLVGRWGEQHCVRVCVFLFVCVCVFACVCVIEVETPHYMGRQGLFAYILL